MPEEAELTASTKEQEVYFGEEYLDKEIREKGWVLTGDSFHDDGNLKEFELPEELVAEELEPHYLPASEKHKFPGATLRNFVCIHPDKAEMKKVYWGRSGGPSVAELKSQEWQLVDSNVVRGIFVRTMPQSGNSPLE